MSTTTNVPQVKINIMDKATFSGITPSPTEWYMITDADNTDWGQSLQGNVATDATFICAPYKCQYNNSITSFSAPNATSAYLAYAFQYCDNLTTLYPFTSMTSGCFAQTFRYCLGLTNLPSGLFGSIDGGYRTFNYTFSDCINLSTVPDNLLTGLTSAGENMCAGMFANCTSIVNISIGFSNLDANSVCLNMFQNCTNLESLSFPNLTTTSFGSTYTNQFNNMLTGTGTGKTHTVHFPSNLEPTIQGLTGYPLFGGTSGYVTLAFDLTATS